MAFFIKKFIIYSGISTAAMVLAILFPVAETFISFLLLSVILIDIGRTIKNKSARKKYIICISIFTSEFIVFSLLSKIINVSLDNTWLGMIASNVIFLTLVVILLKIAKSLPNEHKYIRFILFFIVTTVIFGLLVIDLTALLTGSLFG